MAFSRLPNENQIGIEGGSLKVGLNAYFSLLSTLLFDITVKNKASSVICCILPWPVQVPLADFTQGWKSGTDIFYGKIWP